MIQCSLTICRDFKDSFLFIDTTVLIHASLSDEFRNVIKELVVAGCTLYTISSVVYEFTRSANTLDGYAERLQFIEDLGIIIQTRAEELLGADYVFTVAYNLACGTSGRGPSYTDSLLARMLYKYRHSDVYVMTANHKDMPVSIFDRIEFITVDLTNEIATEAVYRLSEEKLGALLKNAQGLSSTRI